MANILAVLDIDGTTPLSQERRSGVTQPVSEVSLVYSDNSGDGDGQFVLRNTDVNHTALQVEVFTVTYPYDADTGTYLDQQFSYQDPGTQIESSFLNSLTIPEITPGSFMRINRRVIANQDSSTAVHFGNFRVSYLRSSV